MDICDVTVIIPNFNRIGPLYCALMSVQCQSLLPKKVIVVDDCSSAENLKEIRNVLSRFVGGVDIRLLTNSENRGANYCRNAGIRAASTKYIAFLDSDDIWLPNKLSLQMKSIERAEDLDRRPVFSSTGRYRIDGNARIIACQNVKKGFALDAIRCSNFIGTLSSVVVDTDVARKIGGFDVKLPASQDWDFFIRLSEFVQYVGIPSALCVYVDDGQNRITSNHRARIKSHVYIYRKYATGRHARKPALLMNLYRNLSEDLQKIDRVRSAERFYRQYIFLSYKQKYFGLLPSVMCRLLSYLRPMPDVKALRYERYRRGVSRLKADQLKWRSIEGDRILIDQLMRCRDLGS